MSDDIMINIRTLTSIPKQDLLDLDISSFENYLLAEGWKHSHDVKDTARLFINEAVTPSIELPLRRDLVDYLMRICEGLRILADFEKRPVKEIMKDIQKIDADAFNKFSNILPLRFERYLLKNEWHRIADTPDYKYSIFINNHYEKFLPDHIEILILLPKQKEDTYNCKSCLRKAAITLSNIEQKDPCTLFSDISNTILEGE